MRADPERLPRSSSSSSSFRTDPVRSGPVRTKKNEEEEETQTLIALESMRDSLPHDWQPPRWCRRYLTDEALVSGCEQLIGLPSADTLDLLGEWGAEVCEGALLRTVTNMAGGGIRKPRGWYIATIAKGKAWDTGQVNAFVRREWEKVIARLEASGNPQQEAVAAKLRDAAGWPAAEGREDDEAPPYANVVRMGAR